MRKIRWGVLGAGGIADRRTMPGMLKADNAEIYAVMELDKAVAERLRDKYNAAVAYTDELALLDDTKVEAVYIASPVSCHARQVREAAQRGKHILAEKPLALTTKEGDELVALCEEKGVLLAAGLMMRFGSYVREMKKAVEAGKIGQVVSAYAQFTCWYPDMPGNWRQKKSTGGGGALTDMGVHVIDLIQYICGSKTKSVAAMNDTMTFNYEVEDSSCALLRLENGALCAVQANFNIPDEAAKWRLEFFGTKGRLMGDGVIGQVDTGSLDAIFLEESKGYNAQQNNQEAVKAEIEVEFGDAYQREIESFGRSIIEGCPLTVPASDAVQVQRVIEAAYQAGETGQTVKLD